MAPTDDEKQSKIDPAILSRPLGRLADCLRGAAPLRALADAARKVADDAASPLNVVIMGQFKTGKSTLINALLGEDLLTVNVLASTAAVTVLRFGTQRSLVAHAADGSTRAFDLRDLALLSAEGDKAGAAVRRNLSWLEVRLPSPILNNVCLVDTPGLNSSNPRHTEATREFMSRADVVLWVFSALQAGNRDELKQLRALPEGLRPYAIVNQIDQLDEQEQPVDSFLDQCRLSLKGDVKGIIGVSAQLAIDSRDNKDRAGMIKSRWPELLEYLNDAVIGQAVRLKTERTLTRLREVVSSSEEIAAGLLQQRIRATALISQFEIAKKACTDRIDTLIGLMSTWKPTVQKHTGKLIVDNPDLIDHVAGASALNRRLARQRRPTAELMTQIEELSQRRSALENHESELKSRFECHTAEVEKFKVSGFFGGMPLFKDQERNNLNARDAALEAENNQFASDVEQFRRDETTTFTSVDTLRSEVDALLGDIIAAIEATVRQTQGQLEDADRDQRQASLTLETTEWAGLLGESLRTALSEIVDAMERVSPRTQQTLEAGESLNAAIAVAADLASTAGAWSAARITPIPIRFSYSESHPVATEQSHRPPVQTRPFTTRFLWSFAAGVVVLAASLLWYFIPLAPKENKESATQIADASEAAAWDMAGSLNNQEALEKYLRSYPGGAHRLEANQKLDDLHSAQALSQSPALPAVAPIELQTTAVNAPTLPLVASPVPAISAQSNGGTDPSNLLAAPVDEIKLVLDVWVHSMQSNDLDAQMTCYARIVDRYFRATNVEEQTLRKWKAVGMAKWTSTRLDLSEITFHELEPDRFQVEFRKEWDATGSSHFTGASQDALIFKRINVGWKIVDEQETKVYRVSNVPMEKPQSSILGGPVVNLSKIVLLAGIPGSAGNA